MKTLSTQFQIGMYIFSGIFWLLGCIPVVNVISNIFYWMIWFLIFIYKYMPLIFRIAKTGTSIGNLGIKIGIISGIALLLGEIPIVSIFPWDIVANWWTNRLIKKGLKLVEQFEKDTAQLKKGWKSEGPGAKSRSRNTPGTATTAAYNSSA